MAKKEKSPTPPPAEHPLKKESTDRLDGCRKQKREFDLDYREGYAFAAPHLSRDIRSEQIAPENRPHDEDAILADASDLAQDFFTEVMNAFMPEANPWAEQKPGVMLDAKDAADIAQEVKEQDVKIFDAIKASNLYTVLPMCAVDLALGTMGVWIDDPHHAQPFVCQPVPVKELEINIGPHGEIDDRFVVRHTKNRHVEALLPKVDWSKYAECKDRIDDKPDGFTEVRWGFWRKWDRRDDVVWQHVVMVKDDIVHDVEIVGAGSCPLIPIRFNPSAQWAYGWGPLPRSLRELRVLDSLLIGLLDHIDFKLRPPMGFPDDTFASVENGIESGSAYPVRPGSADAVKALFDGGDADAALFDVAKIYERLDRRFYIGFPEQRGKTPPTLGQWLDEMARAQRRIGTPGMPFWREGPNEIFLRYKHMLTKRNTIKEIQVNGKTVSLTPFNPAQRAAEQQDVAMAVQYMGIAGQTWPEESRMEIDGAATMRNIAKKMRVEGLIAFRDNAQKQKAIDNIAKLIEGRQRIGEVDPASLQGVG